MKKLLLIVAGFLLAQACRVGAWSLISGAFNKCVTIHHVFPKEVIPCSKENYPIAYWTGQALEFNVVDFIVDHIGKK